MQRMNEKVMRIGRFALGMMLGAGFVLLLSRPSMAQQQSQATFISPEEATNALLGAVRSNNEDAIVQVLGGGKDLISSGDGLDDRHDRELFVEKFREMHRLVEEPDGTTMLYIGAENWPFPVPLVSKGGKWFFDADAGTQEILFRRVGENETNTIQMCHKLAAAAAADEPQASDPLHGYHFRRLKNGESAAGSPVVVAYPAEYRSSGVMTFVVLPNGTIYEADLGPQTETVAKAITTWKPDRKWRIVQ
jgi:DUF2950 family protein